MVQGHHALRHLIRRRTHAEPCVGIGDGVASDGLQDRGVETDKLLKGLNWLLPRHVGLLGLGVLVDDRLVHSAPTHELVGEEIDCVIADKRRDETGGTEGFGHLAVPARGQETDRGPDAPVDAV